MFERPFCAVVLSASMLACGGSTVNNSSAPSEPAAQATPVETAAAPAPATSDPASSEAVSAGTSAAEAWLKLVDESRYDASWTNAASVFRGAVTSEAWSKAVGGVRGSLGKLLSRKLVSATYTTSVPGAPDGEYVILQFDTSFEKKAAAVETVTPMQDSDGAWRVAGYFIK
jgi:Protein of unknown function (DUF4019)